jgi:hypothetical protein
MFDNVVEGIKGDGTKATRQGAQNWHKAQRSMDKYLPKAKARRRR